jgi:hypothetical protein
MKPGKWWQWLRRVISRMAGKPKGNAGHEQTQMRHQV